MHVSMYNGNHDTLKGKQTVPFSLSLWPHVARREAVAAVAGLLLRATLGL